MTPTNKQASGHAHYRETCTRCIDKDKEISRLKAELQKAAAIKTAAVKVVAAADKLIIGKQNPDKQPPPIKDLTSVQFALRIIGIGIMAPFLLIAFATAMASGNTLLLSLFAICSPIMAMYFLYKLTES